MLRRKFISTVVGAGLATLCGRAADSHFLPEKKANGIKIGQIRINAGLSKPLKFLHFTDSHVVEIDGRDSDRLELAEKRKKAFFYAPRFFLRTMEYARANKMKMLCTGDTIDFVSHKSLEFLKQNMGAEDVIFAVGNHEFSRYVGSRREKEHTEEVCALIQSCIGYDISFASRQIGGLNIITVDNTQYQFSSGQVEQLKAEIRKGLPILVMFHIPVYTEKFFNEIVGKNKKRCSYLAGVPDEKLALNPNEGQRNFHRPQKATLEFAEIIKNEPLVKGVLCGHVHHNIADVLPNGALMVSGAMGASGKALEVVVG